MKKGITLVALVITIIVLLILAGVSISLVVGDNGIATKAQKAKKDTTIEQAKEQLRIAIGTAYTNGEGKIDYDDLNDELYKEFGNNYTISEEDAEEWEITVTTAEGNVTEIVKPTRINYAEEIRAYFQAFFDQDAWYDHIIPINIALPSATVEFMGIDNINMTAYVLVENDVYRVNTERIGNNKYTVTNVEKTDIDVTEIGIQSDKSIRSILDPDEIVISDYTTAYTYNDLNYWAWNGIAYSTGSIYNKWGVHVGNEQE